ncbi:MAG TPA: alkaline phosphatase D family protein [Methylomirabilota bacterium]|nr:alkaline phosphatase D family protein [Methylomirabilota bacterium]
MAALGGCAAVGGPPPSPVDYGPAAFEVTSRSALVWHRLRGGGRLHVEYAIDAGFTQVRRTPVVEATAESDYTVALPLEGLAAGREYLYRAVSEDGRTRGPVGRFRTAPERAGEFTFGFSGDIEAGHQPFTLLDSVVRRRPEFFFLLGDTVYADVPRGRFTPSVAHYREKHRENRDDVHLARLLAATPVYAMWDDHEVHNDFDGTSPYIGEGRQVFREYWPVRGEGGEPSVLYRRFAWGPGADFFALDCRQYRRPKSEADGPGKTMLGARQKAWLKEGLRASRAPFKFVLSSVPFHGPWGPDRWAGYAAERDELLAFVRAERVTGVIVLSADVHAAVDVDLGTGVRELIAGPIGAWPLCRIVPQARAALQASGRFFICDAFNWALLTVRPEAGPPEVELQFIDHTDTVRHRTRVPATG